MVHKNETPVQRPIKQMVAKISRRALKACDSCRRQKTKCFPNSIDDTGSCLRCASVGRLCSFAINGTSNESDYSKEFDMAIDDERSNKKRKLSEESREGSDQDITLSNVFLENNAKLNSIGNNVNKILSLLTDQHQLQQYQNHQQLLSLSPLPTDMASMTSMITPSPSSSSTTIGQSLPAPLQISSTRRPSVSNVRQPLKPSITSTLHDPKDITTESGFAPSITSPFQLIQASMSPEFMPLSVKQFMGNSPAPSLEKIEPNNILSLGIISLSLTIELVNDFKNNYEQWISLPRSLTSEELIHDLRYKCPILLTAICLTTLRYEHSKTVNDDLLVGRLISRLKIELKENLTSFDEFKNLEFLKALVILCVHGHSISSEQLVLDPWFLSGIAIQWFLTLDRNNTFLSLKDHENSNSLIHQLIIDEDEEEKLSNFRIWNHICLVHLANCVFSGRQCLVDEIRLDQSRKNLELPLATNFDGRMIGEISLQLLLYNFIQASSATGDLDEPFENFESELKQWHQQWCYLFEQPSLQFLEFGYHYSYVVALYHYKLGGLAFNEDTHVIKDVPILSKILYHSLKVLKPILKIRQDKTNSFNYLSDQVHLCLYYTCLILIKTIYWIKKFDKSNTYNPMELSKFKSNVETIKEVYKKISRNEKDLAFKYAKGLENTLQKFQL